MNFNKSARPVIMGRNGMVSAGHSLGALAGVKVLQEGGNVQEAVEHLKVATELDPTHVASHLALGRALASLGNKEEALAVLSAGVDAAVSGRSNGGMDLVPEMRNLIATLG